MLISHVEHKLARYADGDLPPGEERAVAKHLQSCERCRHALDEVRFAARLMTELRVVPAPASVWNSIQSTSGARPAVSAWLTPLRWAVACLAAIVAAAGVFYLSRGGTTRDGAIAERWEITRPETRTAERMSPGSLVDTDQSSRAVIKVGSIGTVSVEPATRVRLGQIGAPEFRLSLEVGTISAKIAAPPRLFFVDTPSSTVVDLGCAYTMRVAPDGGGQIQVTEGWTSLEWNGRESLVPAGAMAETRKDVGPGTPFFDDASPRLRQALSVLDFGGGAADALAVVLSESRVRDTLTLWHLLSRVDAASRERVYDRIAALSPPPASVVREKVLQLDAAMLKHWREELAWTW
ncbi:MAG TPA: zf-HC2 domain-containing protein [Vicinamibacterales bacterium]|nr:zf-HC2 domain-containing protein [Vicinamibacterales bacterium]